MNREYIQFQLQTMYHESIDKKKHHFSSGSRSKSRKSKPNDFSVELKPHKASQTMASHEHTSKIKTENSLNKSKGSRNKSKVLKKTKVKESKDISKSVSAERKHTLSKINKTQANFDSEEYLHKRLTNIQKNLNKIPKPKNANTKQIKQFFSHVQTQMESVSEPLCSFLCYVHQIYLTPIAWVLDLISPYQDLLKKKQQLSRLVEDQVKYNESIYSQLDEENVQILKLKQKIQHQRLQIEQKKKQQLEKRKQTIQHNHSMNKNKSSGEIEEPMQPKQKPDGIGSKDLKIDLGKVNRMEVVDYHEQFYSHLDEFSESWRNQALKEKRY